MLVVDGSETINDQDSTSFRTLQDALIVITRQFPISTENVLMGLIQFSDRIDTIVNLGSITNAEEMENAIDGMVYQNGDSTNTTGALKVSADQLQRFGREGVTKQIILLTDGIPDNAQMAVAEANRIKDEGVNITVIGINIQNNQAARITLRDISTTGAVIQANNAGDLDGLVKDIVERACPGLSCVFTFCHK